MTLQPFEPSDLPTLTLRTARARLALLSPGTPDYELDAWLIAAAQRGLLADALASALRAIIVLESPELPGEPSLIRDLAQTALANYPSTPSPLQVEATLAP